MKRASLFLLAIFCLCISAEAQQCRVSIFKGNNKIGAPYYAMPPNGENEVDVRLMGETWVEYQTPDGLRSRVPKTPYTVYRDDIFFSSELNKERLKSITRRELEQEQAEKQYQQFLKDFKCPDREFDAYNVFVEGRVVGTNKKAIDDPVDILIYSNGNLSDSVKVLPDGRFAFGLLPKMYTASFSGEGLVTKSLMFDGRKIPEREAEEGYTVFVEMELYPPAPDTDYSILEETPVGLCDYDVASRTFDFDKSYSKQIRNLVDQLTPQ